MPLILCSWVRNPSSDLTIAGQISTRVNCRVNSAHLRGVALPHCTRTRMHAHTQRSRLPAHPRWGLENVARLSHLNPARTNPDRPVCFIPLKTTRHRLRASSGRDSAGMLGSLLKRASSRPVLLLLRLSSSDGQSIIPVCSGAQIGAQRATRAQKERAAITRSSPSVRLSLCRPYRSWRAACPG